MTRKSRLSDRRRRFSGVWTYTEARAVSPYVASIMGSLREHRLDVFALPACRQAIGRQAG